MRKIILATFLALIFSGAAGIRTSAESYAAADGETGEILFEKNGDKKYPCGTLSKLMTVLLAAEKISSGDLSQDDVLIASERANAVGGAKIWLMPSDRISVSEALKAVIIGNANDASIVLAEKISGSEDEFVKLMNDKAAELSMKNTLYVNSHGFGADGDHTTASDTARLLCRLSEYKFLKDIFLTRTENIRDGTVMLVTSNPDAIGRSGALGFKSGFWEKKNGKRVYYSAEGMKKGDESCFSAAFGYADEELSAEKAFSLIESGFALYDTVKLTPPKEMPTEIAVKDGRRGKVRISANEGKAVIRSGEKKDVSPRIALPDYLYAPVEKGQKIGEILWFYKDRHIFTADITAASSSDKKTLGYGMYKMFKNMCNFG